jgi:quercetin dioxygenase-like cupin family protein
MKTPVPRPAGDAVVLDDDVLALLNAAQAPEPVDAQLSQRVKRRVLDHIAQAEAAQVAVPPEAGTWRPFVAGVKIKVLHDSGGIMSYLLRMEPGSTLPNHRHPHDEECVVVEGSVQMGDVTMGPGGYLMERKDTLHPPLCTVDGATIYLRGASPRKEQLV